VSGQLGSHRLLVASAGLAGLAGAAAFVAAAPSTTLSTPGSPWPYRVGDALFGYVLYVAALAVGPARGVSRYLRAHPYCRSCLVWLQRETSGEVFAPQDARRLRAALAADAYGELRDLPVEGHGPPGRSYRLQWWDCPSCHREAYLRCLPADGEDTGPAVLSRRVVGQPVDELRSLVAHRHRLRERRPGRRQGSQA
jgi:hypothetical protein